MDDAGTLVLGFFFSLFSSDLVSLSRKVKNYQKVSKECATRHLLRRPDCPRPDHMDALSNSS